MRALVEAHLTWVLDHDHEAQARFMYQALALELDGHHRAALLDTKARLKADMMAHLAKLGVLSGARSSEVMADVVLLGPAHQACRAYFYAPGAVDPAWMKATLPDLACGALATLEPAPRAARTRERAGVVEPIQPSGGRRKGKPARG